MTRSSAMAEEALAQTSGNAAYSTSHALSPEMKRITVQTKSGIFAYECATDESLLYAGLRHGLTLPYECATGTCGTCRGRVMDGAVEVAWDEAPGAARLKRDKGDVLMCQARPRKDCLVRVPADVEARACGPDTPAHRHGTIRNLRQLTHDVIHFEVALSSPMNFEAGQFVVLRTPEIAGGRAYSMVNYARGMDSLDLVVKRKPGGGFSEWIFDRDVDCAEVEVFGPLGCATFHPEEDRNILLIAGGSGIAGMMSILERANGQDYFRNHQGHVFFGVRTLADGFYLDELATYVAAANGNLKVTLTLSHEPAPATAHPDFPAIKFAEGMVHEVTSQAMAGRYDDVIGFIAGPPPMVDAAVRVLIVNGELAPQSIRYDKFG